MAENLYIEKHKYSNPKYREGWDRIFKKLNTTKDMVDLFYKELVEEHRKNLIKMTKKDELA